MVSIDEDQEYEEWIRQEELINSVTDNSNTRLFISSFLEFKQKYFLLHVLLEEAVSDPQTAGRLYQKIDTFEELVKNYCENYTLYNILESKNISPLAEGDTFEKFFNEFFLRCVPTDVDIFAHLSKLKIFLLNAKGDVDGYDKLVSENSELFTKVSLAYGDHELKLRGQRMGMEYPEIDFHQQAMKCVGAQRLFVKNHIGKGNFIERLHLTPIGLGLLAVLLLSNIILPFWSFAFLMVLLPLSIRLFMPLSDNVLPKILSWISAFSAPFGLLWLIHVFSPDKDLEGTLFLVALFVPFVNIFLAKIGGEGFSVNKYQIWNLVLLNVMAFLGLPLFLIATVPISILLIFQIFKDEEWNDVITTHDNAEWTEEMSSLPVATEIDENDIKSVLNDFIPNIGKFDI